MPDPLFTFAELVARVCPALGGIDKWKAVRHLDNRPGVPDLVELFHLDREALEFYQAEQSKDVFGGCEGIFSFLGLPGRRALFIGAYQVRGARTATLPDASTVPVALRGMYESARRDECDVVRYYYDLIRDPRFAALEMRVVVDWGLAALTWHQWGLDKPVVELRDPNTLGPCPDYRELEVSLAKLAFLTRHEDANPSWRDKLSAVGGIYLLTDRARGRLYVGQAGGEAGFWGRWKAYAEQCTGNVAIDPAFEAGELRPESAMLSILDVVPRSASAKIVLDRLEVRWKERLCTRLVGYNRN
jgi:hypothetical protein